MNLIRRARRIVLAGLAATTVAIAAGAVGAAQVDAGVASAPSTRTLLTPPTDLAFTALSTAAAPRSPHATPGNTTVKLTWLAPSSNGGSKIDKYLVQRKTSTRAWKTIATPAVRRVRARGLRNGTRYSFRVAAHNSAGWGPYSTAVKAVPRTVPTVPRSPAATPSNAQVKLVWLAPSSNGGAPVDKYAVQRSTTGTSGWTTVGSPTTRSYLAGGLTNGTKYYFRVRAHNTAGWSKPSNTLSGTPRTVPSAPQSLWAGNGNAAAELLWSMPASTGGAVIDTYQVQQAPTTNGPWTPLGTTSQLDYVITGLTNGNTYDFRVRAHNPSGWGPYSTVVSAVPRTLPSPPPTPTATAGDKTVDLTWQPPSNDGGLMVDNYRVEQWAAGSWTQVAETAALNQTVTGLTNGTTYFFRISAHNPTGWSAPSDIAGATPKGPPNPPASCSAGRATPGNTKTISVDWTPPSNDGGLALKTYQVMVQYNWGGVVSNGLTNSLLTHKTVDVPQPNVYKVFVAAYNSAGPSGWCIVNNVDMT
jgi:predicted phage tail protein